MTIPALNEPLFTVLEVSKQLKLDRHAVTDLFANEKGVLVLGEPETTRGSRRYRQLRIPQSVLNRVLARKTVR